MLDHLLDLESDFQAIYGLDIDGMTGAEMMALAWRVAWYPGVIHGLIMAKSQPSDQAVQHMEPEQLPDLFEIVKV